MYSRLTLKHLLLGSLLSSSVKGNMHAKEVREQLEIAGQNYGLEGKWLIQWQPFMHYSEFNFNLYADTLWRARRARFFA